MLAKDSIKFVMGSSYCKWDMKRENKMICTLGLQLCKEKCVLEENSGIKIKTSWVAAKIMGDFSVS